MFLDLRDAEDFMSRTELELNQNKMNAKKKIQFIPMDVLDVMREHAASQYNKLLMGYADFQVDSDVVDGIVEQCVPQGIRYAVANDAGKATWGIHPIIASSRVTEDVLMDMIARLDALVDRADEGYEIDCWCEYNEVTKSISEE